MRQFIEDERIFRIIETDANAQFLDWKERKGANTTTSTIIEKTRRAFKNHNIGLNIASAFMVTNVNGSEEKTNSAVGIGRYLTQKVI
jgi:hypothetical protein